MSAHFNSSSPPQNGLIINLAPTGCVVSKDDTPYLPVSHNEIVDDVAACLELGVQMVHLHVRDEEGKHSSDPERYGRLIESIRDLPGGKELIICVSTSGRHDPSYQSRSRVLDLDGDMKPDMASLTLSSMNFIKGASINEPGTVRRLAARMLENGIKPELEIFDLGMANMADVLIKEELIQGPVYANVLLGNIASAQTSLLHVSSILASLPSDWIISLAGIGRSQLTANMLGIVSTNGVRVGLEDNLWLDDARKELATNADLVKRICRLAEESGRGLKGRVDLRKQLRLSINN